jgi:hypothetical protein
VRLFRQSFEHSNPPAAVERPRPIQPEPEVPGSVPGIRTEIDGDTAMITVDLDEFGSESRPLLLQELAHGSGLTITAHFHHGDDTGFKATRVDLDDKPTRKARSSRKRGPR